MLRGLERRVTQHIKAKTHRFYVVCKPGFEAFLAAEVKRLGITASVEAGQGGVEFDGSIEDCYRVNLASRFATRILLRVKTFKALYFEKLAAALLAIPWELYLKGEIPLKFSVTCRHSRLYHSGRIEAEAGQAIRERLEHVDHFQADSYLFPYHLFIRLQDDLCTVSLDTSGDPLYQRGYKLAASRAPLRENLAALLLQEAGYEQYQCLLDPMCGSGTIPLEAAGLTRGLLAGAMRAFAFQDWPVFRENNFSYIRKELLKELALLQPDDPPFIYASDRDQQAVDTTLQNARRAGLSNNITISRADFFSLQRSDFPEGRLLIVCNPPYGKRIEAASNPVLIYRKIAEKLSRDFPESAYALVMPAALLNRVPGLAYARKKYFMNGGIRVVLLVKE
jgi:putative N6-adenine-specific DNA methylase